jgi:hypothetical protein
MKTITKTIIISVLFFLSEMTNGMAAAELFYGWWNALGSYICGKELNFSEIKKLSPREIKELYNEGRISFKNFTKALITDDEGGVVGGFENAALQEKGFMGALCDKFSIQTGSTEYNELLQACLTNPELKYVPVLVANISDKDVELVRDCPTHNLDPGLCSSVMNASTSKEIAEEINKFVMENNDSSNEALRAQARLCNSILSDLNRFPATLEIGDKKVVLSGTPEFLPDGVAALNPCDNNNKEGTIQAICDAIETQAGLSKEAALAITKQFLLGYRGQSGQVDAQSLVALPMSKKTGTMQNSFNVATDRVPKTGETNGEGQKALKILLQKCPPCVMKFEEESGQWQLRSKTESTPLPAIFKQTGAVRQPLTSGCRFKFPGDAIIRKNLSIESTFDRSSGQFHSPIRENPPRRVIFYGGCKPAGTH